MTDDQKLLMLVNDLCAEFTVYIKGSRIEFLNYVKKQIRKHFRHRWKDEIFQRALRSATHERWKRVKAPDYSEYSESLDKDIRKYIVLPVDTNEPGPRKYKMQSSDTSDLADYVKFEEHRKREGERIGLTADDAENKLHHVRVRIDDGDAAWDDPAIRPPKDRKPRTIIDDDDEDEDGKKHG